MKRLAEILIILCIACFCFAKSLPHDTNSGFRKNSIIDSYYLTIEDEANSLLSCIEDIQIVSLINLYLNCSNYEPAIKPLVYNLQKNDNLRKPKLGFLKIDIPPPYSSI